MLRSLPPLMTNDVPRPDFDQARRMLRALYQTGDWFHVYVSTEKNCPPDAYGNFIKTRMAENGGWWGFQLKSSDGVDGRLDGLIYLDWFDDHIRDRFRRWNMQKMMVATSVCVFARRSSREEHHAVGLSAFAIDIDANSLPALGVDSVEAAIPKAKELLAERGLVPHALVHSGHGLHIYLLIERHRLQTAAQRQEAKQTWYRLCRLLHATDRYDLSSVMRVPGTWNWKNNEPVLTHFLEEHTDLNRRRYTFEDVAKAVENGPPLPKKHREGLAPPKTKIAADKLRVSALPVWTQHVLDVACRLDPDLAAARDLSQNALKGDRSDADYAYAKELVKLGFNIKEVEAEISGSAGAHERGFQYPVSTGSTARAEVLPTKREENSKCYQVFKFSGDALYSIIDRAVSPLPVDEKSAQPTVAIVVARAGGSKTFSIINEMSTPTSLGYGRIGFCSRFKGEILRHEYAINSGWPQGVAGENADGRQWLLDLGLPTNHEDLWQKLPASIREHVDAKGRLVWARHDANNRFVPSSRFLDIRDPAAFYINASHPRWTDEALNPDDDRHVFVDKDGEPHLDEDKERDDSRRHLPVWASSEADLKPRAVAKFAPDAALCLAGFDQEALRSRHPPCSTCTFGSCRSNTNTAVLGGKTLWRQASFALFTHKSHETQGLFARELNNFDSVVFDELPDEVFKVAVIEVKRSGPWDKKGDYEVNPLSGFIRFLQEKLNAADPEFLEKFSGSVERLRTRTREVLTALSDAQERLIKIADNLRRRAEQRSDDDANKFPYVRLDTAFDPLLNVEQFGSLTSVCRAWERFDTDDDIDDVHNHIQVGLRLLREFVGDAPLQLWLDHTFTKSRADGSLYIKRPVNGWDRLVRNPDGSLRKVVLLDATAGIDPRYIPLTGSTEEQYPEADFANTTLVLTASGSFARTKLREAVSEDARGVAEQIASDVQKHLTSFVEPKLLIITEKNESRLKLQPEIERLVRDKRLPTTTTVVWFGSLRGKNDYADYDAVYFTHPHRLPTDDYLGLALVVNGFDEMPKKEWTWLTDVKQGRRADDGSWAKEPSAAFKLAEHLRHRWMTSDIYQDAMRIGVRRDLERRAFIFLPTDETEFVARLMRLFRGAKLITPDGEEILAPRFDNGGYTFEEEFEPSWDEDGI